MKRPVLVIAHDIHFNGGQEKVTAELLTRTSDRPVIVLSRSLPASLTDQFEFHRIRIPSRPFILRFSLFYVLAGIKAARIVRTRRPIVHALGALVPNRVDVSTVHFCHAAYTQGGRQLAPRSVSGARRVLVAVSRAVSLTAERWTYRPGRTAILAPVSAGVQRELHRYYPRMESVVTPNGVDSSKFSPNQVARNELRAAMGYEDTDTVLIFVGGDWHRKGLRHAIHSLHMLPPTFHLWVVGAGSETDAKRGLSATIQQRVRFLGRQENVAKYMQAADVFVLPSTYEAAPLVGLEAAAVGLPIVCTDVNGLADLVREFDCGVVVRPTPEAIAAGVLRCVEDAAYALRSRRAGLASSWEASATSTQAIWAGFDGSE